MTHILNKKFTFKQLFEDAPKMKEGGILVDDLHYLGSAGKGINEVAFFYNPKNKTYYRDSSPHTNNKPSDFTTKVPIINIPVRLRVVKVKNKKIDAKQRMKQGGIVEANKLKVGMKGVDYGDQEGKIIAIAKVKDFEKIKRYDSSGAMQEAIDNADDYGLEPSDTLVAVEMKANRGPFVFVYGHGGFTVDSNKANMKEGGRFDESPNVQKLIKELKWKEEDVIDTWRDDENEERAAIANAVMDSYPYEEGKIIKTIKHPKFGKYMSVNLYDFAGIKVIVQPGMPDGVFYNKKDQKDLLDSTGE